MSLIEASENMLLFGQSFFSSKIYFSKFGKFPLRFEPLDLNNPPPYEMYAGIVKTSLPFRVTTIAMH
jgi:hypothetical protein